MAESVSGHPSLTQADQGELRITVTNESLWATIRVSVAESVSGDPSLAQVDQRKLRDVVPDRVACRMPREWRAMDQERLGITLSFRRFAFGANMCNPSSAQLLITP